MKHNKTERQLLSLTLSMIAIVVMTSCTKKRPAELPEDLQADIYAIAEFGTPSAASAFSASRSDVEPSAEADSVRALNTETSTKLIAEEVNVPGRMKFMFDRLPLIGQTVKNFKITFTVDKHTVTAYKVADASDLTALEKSIAITVREAQLLTEASKASGAELKKVIAQQSQARNESEQIKSSKTAGVLLVPLFKYDIEAVGVLQKQKNDLKEETSILSLKQTDFKNATHIKINSLSDARQVIGLKAGQTKQMSELFVESKLDNQVSTAGELASRLKIGLKFIKEDSKVLTKVDNGNLLIFQITTLDSLSENQKRLLLNNSSNGAIKHCSDADVVAVIASKEQNCVIVMTATVQLEHVKPTLTETDSAGTTSSDIELEKVSRNESIGLVQINEQTPAIQLEMLDNVLDPNSTLKISDLQGEFFLRRTLEDAASSFLGRTGTSGDMALVKFELEDDRIVVRNQMSLIQYTGQGAKDKEEMLSLPVTYLRAIKETANGTKLALPRYVETSKEKAEVARIDWTRNTVPDATSPLAFFDMGSCFRANSSQKVTATDMRLTTDGVLNLSISSSYTVDPECAAIKDVNSAYWKGMAQFNYNVQERISFVRHTNAANTDTQFAMNISPMAQSAFNFGVFTLADLVTNNGTLTNRDGSEKYMPMVHDFRNGRIVKWHLGGINSSATDAERRKLLVEAAQQVVNEWNASFRMSFKGTALERTGDYIQLIVEEPGQETGRLGDLDKNYIWFNEIPADNGLLGVAQPAANPRSGVIESANVIVYTGNTFQQTEKMLKATQLSRSYEKMIEDMKEKAIEEAKKAKEQVSLAEKAQDAKIEKATEAQTEKIKALKAEVELRELKLKKLIQSLNLDQKKFKTALKQYNIKKGSNAGVKMPKLSRDMFKGTRKGQKINYPVNADTFTLKLTELAMDKSLQRNPKELEFRMNDVFMNHAGLSETTKQSLGKRQAQLAMSLRFDRAQQNRPGCFSYTRNEIEDNALNADPDPKKNLMINFKLAVMSTLSHELGHAFGLLHNFTGSTDKANYEFPGEKTGRNYSSIMDYMQDIEQHYAGPGPYDVQAVRAAYTGYVPLNPELRKMNAEQIKNVNIIDGATGPLVSIADVNKLLQQTSMVHYTKDTINPLGILQYFAQCHDGEVGTSAMCALFDNGGSPVEIVKNKIADYTRSYANRSYVYDRILFSWAQKVQAVERNIMLFEDIRGFLDETFMAYFNGTGLDQNADQHRKAELAAAAIEGYKFFHELVRIPDSGVTLADGNRFYAIPYEYNNGTETVSDIKILEARSLYDITRTKDKIDTIGIGYDKMFAMNFLLQASEMSGMDDSQVNYVSYTDFEKYFWGISDPSQSLTMQTTVEILTGNLSAGFFAPSGEMVSVNLPVEANRSLADQTAVAAIIGLNQARWSSYDKFAESLLIARSTVNSAPEGRINVARMGQDRKQSDTAVYYAGQNSQAAAAIIMQAARAELHLDSKSTIYPLLKALHEADRTDKAKGDEEAKKLVAKLRELNQTQLLMPAEYDVPESQYNFDAQVAVMRQELSSQLLLINQILEALAATPEKELDQAMEYINGILKQVAEKNAQLASLPAIAFAQMYMSDSTAELKAKLQVEGEEYVYGSQITAAMMNANKISENHMKLTDVIDQLSIYSRYVDPDLQMTK